MIAGSPALLAREQQILDRYTASLARLIAAETSAGPDDPRPAVASTARSTRAAARKALALLEGGLGGYGVRR